MVDPKYSSGQTTVTAERYRAFDLEHRARSQLHVIRTWGLSALASSYVLVGLFWADFSSRFWLFIVLCLVPSLVALWWAWDSFARAPFLAVAGQTTVTDDALFHAGKTLARREQLAQGLLLQDKDVWFVRLTKRSVFGLPIEFAVRTPQAGTQLLRALGLNADQTTARFRVASRFRACSLHTQVVVILALVVAPLFILWWGITAAGIALLASVGVIPALYLAPASVHIGVDGLVICWLRQERVLRFDQIHRYEQAVHGDFLREIGLKLHLRGGPTVWIPVGYYEPQFVAQTSAFAVRLHEAMLAARSSPRAAAIEALERRARPFAEWVTALRRVGAGAYGGHRSAPVEVETLRALTEDVTRPTLERAAAAIALVEAAPQERPRIGVLAKTTVSAPLACVLTQVAEGALEEPALAEALAVLEAEEARSTG